MQATKSTIRFRARLGQPQAAAKGSDLLLTLPAKSSASLPSRSSITVEGTINGFPFRAILQPNGKGSHWLKVRKALQDAAGAEDDGIVTVEITRAGDEPETRIPSDLRKSLRAAPRARALWEDTTPVARRDWILWISSTQPEMRTRRIGKACDMLASGKRRVCCFGGIKWLMKDNPNAKGSWEELPSANKRPSDRKIAG